MKYKDDTRIYKISYLLMSDTIDRLDTILLELRHLQRNIIYFMHEPGFNAVLRFEEDFLWKEEWENLFPSNDSEKYLNTVIKDNILLFPNPPLEEPIKTVGYIRCDDNRSEIRDKITKNLKQRIYYLWNQDEWGIRYRRSYDSLRGTQILKRIIVKEKIKFLFFAMNHANITPREHSRDDMNPAALAQFIILRDAVYQRCKQYLSRLMEYQSLFNKVLDIGVKEFPVPSLERRREIGIYMDFLDHSVRAVHKQTKHLISKLMKAELKKDENIILHGWKHHFTSEYHFQKSYDADEKTDINHVTTSYWMPERFDLRPIIAHEISHLIIEKYFDGLSDYFFQYTKNSRFVDMLRSLFRVCSEYDQQCDIGELSPVHKPRALINEITCDLLASTVKGFSYFYASLLESIGSGLYKHLLAGNLEFVKNSAEAIDLDIIHSLYGTGGHPGTMQRDWWLRLKIMIFWLKNTHFISCSDLDLLLLDGSNSLLDNLIVFLDEITPQPEKKTGDIWMGLANRLCEVIKDCSGAVKEITEWRKKRSFASRDEETGDYGPFHRSVRKIDDEIIDALKKIHIGLKTAEGKGLHGKIGKNLDEEFNKIYLIDKPSRSSQFSKENNWPKEYIYNHLYDIPWKCALTRAIDLFGNTDDPDNDKDSHKSKNSWLDHYEDDRQRKFLHILHHDNAMGRELHSLALEFYMLNAENPVDRLMYAVQMLEHMKKKEIGKTPIPFDEWLKKAKNVLAKNRKGKSSGFGDQERDAIRKTEQESDDASREFVDFFNEEAKFYDSSVKESLLALRNYLAFHGDAHNKNITKIILDEITHTHNEYIKCKFKKNGTDNIRCFRMLLVSRHTAGGFYASENGESDYMTDRDRLNPVSLLTGNTYWLWTESEKKEKTANLKERIAELNEKEDCVYPFEIFRYSNVSGRYDALSFVRVRQMRRCSLPHFEAKDGNDELWQYHFPSVLSRREFGIKIDLDFQKDCDSSKLDKPEEYHNYLAGYISVVLKRRALRLPFLARLLASAKGNDAPAKENDECDNDNRKKLRKYILEEKILAKYLQETDTALLLDGSADFLLVLRDKGDVKKPSLSRIDAVMNLAYWLHQDFMVDRTEIILAASALDNVAENIAAHSDSPYSLECEIRCFEDRFLAHRLNEVKKQLTANAGNGKGANNLRVTFEITAGRKDFLLQSTSA